MVKKRKKNAQGAWIIWRRKREKNGARGRRDPAKRQRANVYVHANVYIQYPREFLLSSKTIERIHN